MFSLPKILSPYSDSVTYYIAVPSYDQLLGVGVSITVCVKEETPSVTRKQIYRAIKLLITPQELIELTHQAHPEWEFTGHIFLRVSVVTDRRKS